MLSVILDVTIESTRKASRSLARDYTELQMLQSTKPESRERFAMQSLHRGVELLHSELVEKSDFRVANKLPSELTGDKPVAHFMVLDGLRNLKRGMPYFASCVQLYDHITGDMKAVVVNFPALGEIVYAQAGSGVFVERFRDMHNNHSNQRMRVSRTEKSEEAVVVFSHALDNGQIMDLCNKMSINFVQIRNFGSNIYGAYMLVAGKVDVLCLAQTDPLLPAIKLWVQEAGGRIYDQGDIVCFTNNSLTIK